ncbi:MAG: phosphoadenosine phosphosulfate reductase family protein [Candidatus Undinarchaeales archaeon]|nr:phosphoadenosine phosphosulfate reductase family protein [Candidatus Undinarchaeales archaeon]MDP7492885.1 phosphoadenosine phosphosulfate reductase family protein [Candidatus Undinarchaeales archaeon]
MPAPVLGKTTLGWCEQCNVPVIGRKCGRCEAQPRSISLTPPADTKPAFPWDVEHINAFFSERYGAPLLRDDRVAVMSSTAGFDCAYEILTDGVKLCIIGTDDAGVEFCKLYIAGAQRLADGGARGSVTIEEDVVRFLEHGDLLRPGVDGADPEIRNGQEVYVHVNGRVVATGTARMNGDEMGTRERGVAVKVRRFGRSDGDDLGPSTWDDAVEANSRRLDNIERHAMAFMRKAVHRNKGHPLVAMSGGKDSMVTLVIAKKALEEFDVLFVDTGLEFEETVKCVHDSCKALGLEERLIVASAGDGFWRNLQTFGPPAMDYRWCCKVAKLGPVSRTIGERWGSTLTFGGERKYESFSRAKRPPIDRNPWVPNQLSAYPILDWTGLDVWLYLLREKVPVNPMYHRGHERVGCWMCPSSSAWGFKRLAETHPDLAQRWDDIVQEHAKRHNLGDEWAQGGWRRHGHGEKQCLKGGAPMATIISESGGGDVNMFDVKIEGWEDSHLLSMLGVVDNEDGITIEMRDATLMIGPDGSANVLGEDLTREGVHEILESVCKVLVRDRACTGCGICVSACPCDALSFLGRLMLDDKRCTKCGKCLAQACPLDFLGRDEA